MRILVCGGRNFAHVIRTKGTIAEESPETQERIKEYRFVHDTLNRLVAQKSKLFNPVDNWLPTDITIITGAAKGADSAAGDFAITSFCHLAEFPAKWDEHGRAAGPIRNQQMINEGRPDYFVAFPGGKGTADMVKRLKAAKIDGIVVEYTRI